MPLAKTEVRKGHPLEQVQAIVNRLERLGIRYTSTGLSLDMVRSCRKRSIQKMSWLLWALGIIGFFYLVGKLTTKPDNQVTSIATRTRTVTYETKREQYLPWSNEPYHHTHLFKLFGTDAGLAWNDGDDMVDVYCISRFSKGKPQTKVYSRFYYGTQDGLWHNPPKGAANECLKEIIEILKLNNKP